MQSLELLSLIFHQGLTCQQRRQPFVPHAVLDTTAHQGIPKLIVLKGTTVPVEQDQIGSLVRQGHLVHKHDWRRLILALSAALGRTALWKMHKL